MKLRQLRHWIQIRDKNYLIIRLISLMRRYRITSAAVEHRIVSYVRQLARYGCYPTFPTPGRVISRKATFFRELQKIGVELAVHGYDHIDFRSLSKPEVTRQFAKAANSFAQGEIQFEGFRCPYLSYTDDLSQAIPEGMFKYSSNKAIWWDVVSAESIDGKTSVFDNLRRFYRASSSEDTISVPQWSGNLLEIPVSVPDDIQLYDGLQLGEGGAKRAWLELLCQTHRRGELFVLMFHPELFHQCMPALESVLTLASSAVPAVWISQLRAVSSWWQEKSGFSAAISTDESGMHVCFNCSKRATILMRNIETAARAHAWDGVYEVLEDRRLDVPLDQRPFVGLSPDLPTSTRTFIKEQGYIVDESELAARCTVYLDSTALAKLDNQVQLINCIEATSGPLVRFWRWPDEMKSALCVTGDLDALSLVDYASRLFTA